MKYRSPNLNQKVQVEGPGVFDLVDCVWPHSLPLSSIFQLPEIPALPCKFCEEPECVPSGLYLVEKSKPVRVVPLMVAPLTKVLNSSADSFFAP